ncbi:hypothetical protein, partial [Mobiluncus mulieris]|uniref:hypothetical protein n=1 Tax=Mobiluncus mulieris TaxID=2052 RepID=UPI0021E31DD1
YLSHFTRLACFKQHAWIQVRSAAVGAGSGGAGRGYWLFISGGGMSRMMDCGVVSGFTRCLP